MTVSLIECGPDGVLKSGQSIFIRDFALPQNNPVHEEVHIRGIILLRMAEYGIYLHGLSSR